MIINYEFRRIWKEDVVAYLKVDYSSDILLEWMRNTKKTHGLDLRNLKLASNLCTTICNFERDGEENNQNVLRWIEPPTVTLHSTQY
jgi:hypothetical protein